MQGWLVAGAWLCAVLLAVVVVGFVAYELSWKSRRLLDERAKLELTIADLSAVAAQLRSAAGPHK